MRSCAFIVVALLVCLQLDAAEPMTPERRAADMAVKRYDLEIVAAKRAYDDAVAKAQKKLSDGYNMAIDGALKKGAAGLDEANALKAEKDKKLAANDEREIAGPSLAEIQRMLDGVTYHEGGEQGGKAYSFRVKDRKITESNGTQWTVEPRWLLVHPDCLLIPNGKELRGFVVPSGHPYVFGAPER